MLYVIREAERYFHDKTEWNKIIHNAMSCDFSWKKPTREYMALYRKITGKA